MKPPDDDEKSPDGAKPYEVGYKKPPKASRFRVGQSGNPRGRPKGSRSRGSTAATVDRMKSIVLSEAYRPIQIRDGNETVILPVFAASVRSLTLSAVKGSLPAQKLLLELVEKIEAEQSRDRRIAFETSVEYKAQADQEVARRRANNLPEDDILPHPDEIIIDPFSGTVTTIGPWTLEEQARRKQIRALRAEIRKDLKDAEAELRVAPDESALKSRILVLRSTLARADVALGDFRRTIVDGI